MDDFEGPSFSLGLDLDFELEVDAPRDEPVYTEAPECSINVSSQSCKEDEQFQQETLYPDVYIEDPPPLLKRLKRGSPPTHSSVFDKKKRESPVLSWNVDDDIEEFSSQEGSPRDKHSVVQNRSVWSSSKIPLHGHSVLTKHSVTKLNTQKDTPSNASTSTSFEATNKNSFMFPKLTISPLRKFQLVDSDSDDPSAIDDPHKDANTVNTSGMKKPCYHSQSVTGNQQKKANLSASTLKSGDLWKEFTPKKSLNIQTPALDEFCEEYFKSVKDTNLGQGKEDMCLSSSKACSQKKSISQYMTQSDSVPPAYQYYHHDDLRIQRLVRDRLSHFSPLCLEKQSDAAAIDYMSQFGHKENPLQSRGHANMELGQSSQRGKKNYKKTNVKEAVQASSNWVSPKSCVNIPKDASKRRVQANNHSSGHWYTDQDGKKVYVNKTGQILTGRIAYRHHRKESGAGFRKSRKKATSKKKSK